ncbi:MAG: peptidoglycan DD-metalloendopeptidase family protein [Deltaproteobacteria bacterium]|nr:MAG: peptidoglycan DD-metalloendopeptidase family protein [Deltaproteobacteria bacterium]
MLFLVITACLLIPTNFSGSGVHLSIASAQEDSLPGNLQESFRNKLTKKQQQEIIEKNARIRKLQEGIIDHKIKILGSRKKERTLLGELEKIEKELQIQKNMLGTLRTESEKQEVLLSDKQQYLREVLKEKRAHQVHVKTRLAAYYRMGSVGLMNVVFSSESLPELLDFQEYFGIMVQHDHAIIQKYLAQLKESNRAREEHSREKLRLMKLADEVKANEQELKRIKQEKNLLLKQVNTEQHLYEQAVQEIEEAAADLAETLQRIQTAAAPKQVTPKPSAKIETEKKKLPQTALLVQDGFPGRKGLLDPPVQGIVITHFGQKVKGKFESFTIANGIDIRVKSGVEIKAVYDGKIIHSGYLRGYGNLMIIDHGDQYFSLISRAADFYKKEGTRVATREIIGITGEGDPLYGEGLHFEIRKGSNPEDPLLWLKENILPLETSAPKVQ